MRLATKHVELYGAQLRIHAVFSGLRYLMYHYPLTAAALGIGICMVFLSAVVILSWYQFSGSAGKQVRDQNDKRVIFLDLTWSWCYCVIVVVGNVNSDYVASCIFSRCYYIILSLLVFIYIYVDIFFSHHFLYQSVFPFCYCLC